MSANAVKPKGMQTDNATTAAASAAVTERKPENGATSWWDSVASPAGYILAVSYPVLALSTGVRALYQLFLKAGVADYLPPAMSGLAALCYLTAAIGFAYRRRWAWWLSVLVLGLETLLTLIIGTWSYIDPDLIGSTVWRHFGADYGYFPLFQPLLGLLWLFWPVTLVAYGIRTTTQPTQEHEPQEHEPQKHEPEAMAN